MHPVYSTDYTFSDVLHRAHLLNNWSGDYNISDKHPADAIAALTKHRHPYEEESLRR